MRMAAVLRTMMQPRWPTPSGRPMGSNFAFDEATRLVESFDMPEYFRWWVVDQRTGKRLLTDERISREDAQSQFPGAVPEPQTREFREDELFADSLPPA
jgi:hypothetical protein